MQKNDFLLFFFCKFESLSSTTPRMSDKSNDKVCLFNHPLVAFYDSETIWCCFDRRVKDVVIVQSHIFVPFFIGRCDIWRDKDFLIFYPGIGNSRGINDLRDKRIESAIPATIKSKRETLGLRFLI